MGGNVESPAGSRGRLTGLSLSQRLLATLAESPIPCPTPQLTAICTEGRKYDRGWVWGKLLELERSGLVRRGYTRLPVPRGEHGRPIRIATWTLT